MNGVTFGTKHSYVDFGLILSSTEITLPEAKIKTVEVPGADGIIDLTEALTDDVKYKNRKLSFTFTVIDPLASWSSKLSELSNYVHGRNLQIIRDVDKGYYYTGRCNVNQFKPNKRTATIVIECNVEPYKLEVNAGENWLWNTFSLVDGFLSLSEITVVTSKTIKLTNNRKIVSPTFTCTNKMSVSFNGKTYSLPTGTTTVLDIRLQEGDNYLTLFGTGKVRIQHRGGSL